MSNRLLYAFLLLFVLLLVAPSGARAQEVQPGDPCTVANSFTHVGGPENPGAGLLLVCDGAAWKLVTEWDNSANLGVKQTAPKAPLHVGGEAIVGNTGLTCDADRAGGLRWSSVNTTIEMCNGVAWQKIVASAGGMDCTPNFFAFTDVIDQPLSTTIASNILTITGIDPGCAVTVTGSGSPQVSVNSGAWTNGTLINPGDTLQVRQLSSGTPSTARIAAVAVGTLSDNWSVTTLTGQTKIFITSNDYNGNLGGIGGAHSICQTEAGNLGYTGLWRALLSNSGMNARDLLTIAYPVIRPTGTTVDAVNIWDGSLTTAVTTTNTRAWTGSNTAGTKYYTWNTSALSDPAAYCNNWRDGSVSYGAEFGEPEVSSGAWIDNGSNNCNNLYRLYCVFQENPLGAKLVIGPSSRSGINVLGTGSPAYGDAVTFTVENVGDTTSATITTGLSNTTNFEFVTDNCDGNTLAQGATCTVSIRAKATFPGESEGPISGTFNVTANNNPSASLSGYKAGGGTRIFATSSGYTGSMGGIGGAHTTCQAVAGGLGYSGYWRALLSNSGINAKDLLTITYPVVRASGGTTVDAANIWDGSLTAAVSTSALNVWTGTGSDGNKYSTWGGGASTSPTHYCDDWRNGTNSRSAQYGDSELTSTWSYRDSQYCDQAYSLYCVEQASPIGARLTIAPSTRSGVNVFGTGSPAYGSAVTFTVENVGDATSATMSTSLSNTTNFEFVTDNCNGNTLAQGATCTVSVRALATFPGETPGNISGTFNVTANNNPSASISGYKAEAATRIFITPTQYAATLGGLAGADTSCQDAATALGYGGTWKAILSNSTTNAKDRLTIVYPVVRASGGVIVDTTNIWDGSLTNAVSTTSDYAWTGSDSSGNRSGSFCGDWTNTSGSSIMGDLDTSSGAWLNYGTYACTNLRRLYCVEQ